HQLVAALHISWTLGQSLKDQELRHRQTHRLALPGAGVAVGVERELAADDRLLVAVLRGRAARARAAPYRPHPPLVQALRKWLCYVIVGADIKADHLVHLVIL